MGMGPDTGKAIHRCSGDSALIWMMEQGERQSGLRAQSETSINLTHFWWQAPTNLRSLAGKELVVGTQLTALLPWPR